MHSGGIFTEVGRNAFVDWLFILSISAIVMIMLAVGGVYLYWQVANGKVKGTQEEVVTDEKIFDENELTAIMSRYSQREDNSIRIIEGYVGTVDTTL